jgi:hypothetical protein
VGIRFYSPIRRIYALPRPNELYLRVAVYMYEPGAVAARLGRGAEEKDDYDPHGPESYRSLS